MLFFRVCWVLQWMNGMLHVCFFRKHIICMSKRPTSRRPSLGERCFCYCFWTAEVFGCRCYLQQASFKSLAKLWRSMIQWPTCRYLPPSSSYHLPCLGPLESSGAIWGSCGEQPTTGFAAPATISQVANKVRRAYRPTYIICFRKWKEDGRSCKRVTLKPSKSQ